jgi:hypothetical protein
MADRPSSRNTRSGRYRCGISRKHPRPSRPEPLRNRTPEEEEQEETDETQQPDKGGKGVQKRFDELTKARRNAERENAELKQRLEALERGSRPANDSANQAQQQRQTQQAPAGEPKIEDFDSYAEYYKALVKHELDQRETVRSAQTAQQTAIAAWDTKQEAARKEHADYDAVLENAQIPNTPALPAVRQFLSDEALGAKILYTLAKDPAETQRIMALSPIMAVAELGALKAKLATAAPPANARPPRKETAAPAPPRRVDGRFASAQAVDDPDIPFDEFDRRR